MSGVVLAVSRSPTHTFSKPNHTSIRLLAGLGVEGDAHMGQTVKHRSRENITTRGIDLLGLPTGTRLHIGASAVVEVTGLRNPCDQLDQFQSGLKAAVLGRDDQGNLIPQGRCDGDCAGER